MYSKGLNRRRMFYPLKPSYTEKTGANVKSTLLKGALKFIISEKL